MPFGMMVPVGADDKISPDVLNDALTSSADGFSSDEVMIRDELRREFLNEVGRRVGHSIAVDQERDVFLSLLQLRKAGKMTYRATKRAPSPTSNVSTVAEIAARAVIDRHSVSSDVMLADSVLRAELQAEARLIDPSVDGYEVRKSVLGLRKKRSLRPELVLQVANWDREVVTWSLAELIAKLKADQVPHSPGVYLFRTDEGYLYIGEAIDLSDRLTQHTEGSDRVSLADYLSHAQPGEVSVELHVFPKDSPARKVTVRRAYESELIRSRHPKLNVRP